jgi:hypothetical protein
MVQFLTGKVRSIIASGVLLALLISVIVAFTFFTPRFAGHVRTDIRWNVAAQRQVSIAYLAISDERERADCRATNQAHTVPLSGNAPNTYVYSSYHL